MLTVTAKEQLRQTIEDLSELEAEQALAFIAHRRERDPLVELVENAPEDDEASTPEEDRSAAEAWAQRRDSVALGEIERELG